MSAATQSITRLLQEASHGNNRALADLAPLVYDELRELASRSLWGQPAGHTLRTTALVNEAYIKLVDQTQVHWQGRSHFIGVAAKAMRSILVDHARSKKRLKRGGERRPVPLDDALAVIEDQRIDLLALDDALTRLASLDQRKARVVELLFFGGLSVDETARMLDLSPSSVDREWRLARAWLFREIGGEEVESQRSDVSGECHDMADV